ncbi:uncharacterized protein LOC117554935 [Gymnodraco acuticeps]|uniref:Uncharacterized protein LOC117554935 n=1 Tax=Gymnodraco acuticeps TaxID=8218 RepID=A0A6P8V6H1_GYMAC|nr:uncharacterized protein LOC117554935 [Gymnodraco acuticeps]
MARSLRALEREVVELQGLADSTGEPEHLLQESADIRQCAVEFYKELYRTEFQAEPEVAQSFYEGLPNVPEEDHAELEAELSAQELQEALQSMQSMQSGKAPGIDGLPADFYKALWPVIDKLFQPNISVSSSMYGVSGAQQQGFQVFRGSTFSISCSIQPQYPGGSFLLSSSTHNYTQPAVNHSAHFLFPAAEPAHQGNYSCVYHVSASPQDSSSESRLLSVTVTGVPSDPEPFIIRAVVLLLTQLLVLLVTIGLTLLTETLCATRGRRLSRQEDIELDYDDLGVPAEEEGAQGAE